MRTRDSLEPELRTQRELNKWVIASVSLVSLVAGVLLISVPPLAGAPAAVTSILEQIGTVIVTSVVIGIAYDYVVRRRFLREVQLRFDVALATASELVTSARASGVQRIHESLPINEVVLQIDDAKKRIRIMQSWLPNAYILANHLVDAAKRGVRIEILLLKRDSAYLVARKRQLGPKSPGSAAHETQSNLDALHNLLEVSYKAGNVELRFYDEPPGFAIYAIDGQIHLGFMWTHRGSVGAPQLEFVEDSGWFADCVQAHFDAVWGAATPFTLPNSTPETQPSRIDNQKGETIDPEPKE